MSVYNCASVIVCVLAILRDRVLVYGCVCESETERERGCVCGCRWVSVSVCVCVCVCVRVFIIIRQRPTNEKWPRLKKAGKTSSNGSH